MSGSPSGPVGPGVWCPPGSGPSLGEVTLHDRRTGGLLAGALPVRGRHAVAGALGRAGPVAGLTVDVGGVGQFDRGLHDEVLDRAPAVVGDQLQPARVSVPSTVSMSSSHSVGATRLGGHRAAIAAALRVARAAGAVERASAWSQIGDADPGEARRRRRRRAAARRAAPDRSCAARARSRPARHRS